MSKFIEKLISDLVVNDMKTVSKMKKSEILKLTEILLRDNYRELLDESIIEVHELQFRGRVPTT